MSSTAKNSRSSSGSSCQIQPTVQIVFIKFIQMIFTRHVQNGARQTGEKHYHQKTSSLFRIYWLFGNRISKAIGNYFQNAFENEIRVLLPRRAKKDKKNYSIDRHTLNLNSLNCINTHCWVQSLCVTFSFSSRLKTSKTVVNYSCCTVQSIAYTVLFGKKTEKKESRTI